QYFSMPQTSKAPAPKDNKASLPDPAPTSLVKSHGSALPRIPGFGAHKRATKRNRPTPIATRGGSSAIPFPAANRPTPPSPSPPHQAHRPIRPHDLFHVQPVNHLAHPVRPEIPPGHRVLLGEPRPHLR